MSEVGTSELAEVMAGGLIIGQRCCFFVLVPTEEDRLLVDLDLRHPRTAFLVPADTFVLRGSTDLRTLVPHVLAACGETEIAASVVETIAVDVIDVHALRGVHDQPVHQNASGASDGVGATVGEVDGPAVLLDESIVGLVDERNVTLRKLDLHHKATIADRR